MIPAIEIPSTVVSAEAVIRLLTSHLVETGELPGDQLESIVAGLLHRESLGSTNVGRGVAVPHLVAPAVNGTAILLGRLTTPLIWSEDNVEPVRQVYLVLTAERTDYLVCLEQISRHLRDGDRTA